MKCHHRDTEDNREWTRMNTNRLDPEATLIAVQLRLAF
jgi:hypothetical protein